MHAIYIYTRIGSFGRDRYFYCSKFYAGQTRRQTVLKWSFLFEMCTKTHACSSLHRIFLVTETELD